jgi:hypothetical protein
MLPSAFISCRQIQRQNGRDLPGFDSKYCRVGNSWRPFFKACSCQDWCQQLGRGNLSPAEVFMIVGSSYYSNLVMLNPLAGQKRIRPAHSEMNRRQCSARLRQFAMVFAVQIHHRSHNQLLMQCKHTIAPTATPLRVQIHHRSYSHPFARANTPSLLQQGPGSYNQ